MLDRGVLFRNALVIDEGWKLGGFDGQATGKQQHERPAVSSD